MFPWLPIQQPEQSPVVSEENGLSWKSVIQCSQSPALHTSFVIYCESNAEWSSVYVGVAFSLWIVGLEFYLLGRCWRFSRGVVHWVCSMPFLLICQNSQHDWELQPAIIHLLQIRTIRRGCSLKKRWTDLVLEDESWKHLNRKKSK